MKKCISCKKSISFYAKRCKICSNKSRIGIKMKINRFGKNNPNYKDGRTNKKYYCIDCGKQLSSCYTYLNKTKRCRKCCTIYLYKIQKLKAKGKYNSSWIDGRSFEPYTSKFTEQLKDQIRKRDNHKCRLCNKTQQQELINLKKKLSIHHIDYNKQNCKANNLITTCSKCNAKINFNRDYWFAYFTYLIEG